MAKFNITTRVNIVFINLLQEMKQETGISISKIVELSLMDYYEKIIKNKKKLNRFKRIIKLMNLRVKHKEIKHQYYVILNTYKTLIKLSNSTLFHKGDFNEKLIKDIIDMALKEIKYFSPKVKKVLKEEINLFKILKKNPEELKSKIDFLKNRIEELK